MGARRRNRAGQSRSRAMKAALSLRAWSAAPGRRTALAELVRQPETLAGPLFLASADRPGARPGPRDICPHTAVRGDGAVASAAASTAPTGSCSSRAARQARPGAEAVSSPGGILSGHRTSPLPPPARHRWPAVPSKVLPPQIGLLIRSRRSSGCPRAASVWATFST